MLFTVASSLQFPSLASVYERFAGFDLPSPEPTGQLVLHGRLDREGVAVSIAANIAGAASLCMEPEGALAKQAVRGGICDMMVRDLAEAREILQDERGKPRPIAIAVLGEPEVVTQEVLESGLTPTFVHLYENGRAIPGAEALLANGARPLPAQPQYDETIAVGWSVAREPLRWLPLTDTIAARILDSQERSTAQRKRWIEVSPSFLGRTYAAQRFLPMTPAEADAFCAAVQQDVEGGEIQVAVSIVRNGQELLLAS